MFEEQNQDVQNEVEENLSKTNIKKEKKSKSLLFKENSKYIAKVLLNFNITEENKKLEEMLTDLELFRAEYKENQEKNTINFENEEQSNLTKLLIYNALEKNLIEISYIDNKEIRTNRLNSLYLWYKDKNKINEDLKKINSKSYNELYEIGEDEFLKDKEEKEENEEENNEENEDEKIIKK